MGRLLLWPLVFWGKLWGPSISQFRSLFVAIILSLEPFHHLPFRWPVVSWGLHSHEHGRLWSEYHVNFMLPCSCSMCAYVKFVRIYYGYIFDCDIYIYKYIFNFCKYVYECIHICIYIYMYYTYIQYIYMYILSFPWKTIESHNVFFSHWHERFFGREVLEVSENMKLRKSFSSQREFRCSFGQMLPSCSTDVRWHGWYGRKKHTKQTTSSLWFLIFADFYPYLGKILILTNLFQLGWNHQLEKDRAMANTLLVVSLVEEILKWHFGLPKRYLLLP